MPVAEKIPVPMTSEDVFNMDFSAPPTEEPPPFKFHRWKEKLPEVSTAETRFPEPMKILKKVSDLQEGESPLPNGRSLSAKERVFVTLVFNGMGADEAAEQAGFEFKRNDVGMILFRRPHIKEALEWMQSEFIRAMGATLTNAVQQICNIAFLDPRKVVDSETGEPIPLHQLDRATASALAAVDVTTTEFNGVSKVTKTRYKFNDKLKALQQLGDHLGIFKVPTQKVEVTGEGGGPIQMEMSQTEVARRIAFALRGNIIDAATAEDATVVDTMTEDPPTEIDNGNEG